MPDNRITIFVGNYGSGKTELSVNYALHLAAAGVKTGLIDLDIVNPYFRSRERAGLLMEQGVNVVLPQAEYIYAEVPALPPEISGMLANRAYQVVVDVGGDNTGARALGRFAGQVAAENYRMIMVVNASRPETDTPAGVVRLLRAIEQASGLPVSALVNNTNLAWETDLELVAAGQALVEAAAAEVHLPVDFTVVARSLEAAARKRLAGAKIFPIDPLMGLGWVQD